MRISRRPPTSSQDPLSRGGELTPEPRNNSRQPADPHQTPHLAVSLLIGGPFPVLRAWRSNSSLQLCPSCEAFHAGICFLLWFASQPSEPKCARTGRKLGKPTANITRLYSVLIHARWKFYQIRSGKLELIACMWGLIKRSIFFSPQ